jgi:hypothetical protein
MGQLGDFTIDQIAGSVALVLGSLGGLLLIIFKSRCVNINCCWGLWSCDREVASDEDEPSPEPEPEEQEPVIPPNAS